MPPTSKVSKPKTKGSDTQGLRNYFQNLPDAVLESLRTSMVTVEAGPNKWDLPKELLSKHSTYFEKLFDSDKKLEHVTLDPEFDHETFPLFIEFILTGRFKKQAGYLLWTSPNGGLGKVGQISDNDHECVEWHTKACIWAYVLAFRLGATGLMDLVMHSIYKRWRVGSMLKPHMHPHAASYACKLWNGHSSPLRDFMYHWVFSWWGHPFNIRREDQRWMDFLKEHAEVRDNILKHSQVSKDLCGEIDAYLTKRNDDSGKICPSLAPG